MQWVNSNYKGVDTMPEQIELTPKELALTKEIISHCEEHQRWLISDKEGFNLAEFETLKQKLERK